MNVRIFWVRAMKCMCAQTRPRFILSSERVFGGMEFEPMLTPRENPLYRKISPEEDRTRDAVDSEPKHYQRAIPDPCADQTTWKKESNSAEYTLSGSVKQNWKMWYKLWQIDSTNPSVRPPRWPSGKAFASRAEDPGFESRLHWDFRGRVIPVTKNWHSIGYPARRLAL